MISWEIRRSSRSWRRWRPFNRRRNFARRWATATTITFRKPLRWWRRDALAELIPDLLATFDRFMIDPVKTDPQCWAKNAIAKALQGFALDDASFYVRGLKHIQLEPGWGPPADTAGTLRGICAFALTQCSIPRAEAMRHLVDLLGADKEKIVRIDAARAIGHLSGTEAALLLRLKSLTGDPEPEVIGQCFASLLDLAPTDYIPFVANFISRDDDVRFEAAAALGELPDPAAVAALTDHFAKSKDPETRRAIVLSLGASRLEPARDFLLATLENGGSEDASYLCSSPRGQPLSRRGAGSRRQNCKRSRRAQTNRRASF